MSHTRTAAWRRRVDRDHLVPGAGAHTDGLLARPLSTYDRDTVATAGLPRVGEQHKAVHERLYERTERTLVCLFKDQLAVLEKSTARRFQETLLQRVYGRRMPTLRSSSRQMHAAVLAFDASASSLELPSLSLNKVRALADVEGKLGTVLMALPDSPTAKLKALVRV